MLGLAVLLGLLGTGAGYEVCYGKECYKTGPPYGGTEDRPFPVIPYPCPVSYFLLTRRNMDHPEEICSSHRDTLTSSYFAAEEKTYIIIHGMLHSVREPWVRKMCQTILEAEPANCIMMDWSSCSWDLYMRQIQRLRILGSELGRMLGSLEATYSCSLENIYLIGSNVGAHIAGYAGKVKRNIGGIVGLNPPLVMFSGDAALHLTKTDATFVQIFHSDANPVSEFGSGLIDPIGHLDVYLNKGRKMAECPPRRMTPVEAACLLLPVLGPLTPESCTFPTAQCEEIMGDAKYTLEDILSLDYNLCCDLYQAIIYYTDSIKNPGKYRGNQCDSAENCMAGVTWPCPPEGCRQLGHYAQPLPGETNQMYQINATVTPVLS